MTNVLAWIVNRKSDLDTTIRTVAELAGQPAIDIVTVTESDVSAPQFLKGYHKALEDVALIVPEKPIVMGAPELTTKQRSLRSRKTQRLYWNAVRQIMKDENVTTLEARRLYAKRASSKAA